VIAVVMGRLKVSEFQMTAYATLGDIYLKGTQHGLFCTECGFKNLDGAVFCAGCGQTDGLCMRM
jgi:hypothetical protein